MEHGFIVRSGWRDSWWTVFAIVPEIFNHAVAGFGLFSSKSRQLDPPCLVAPAVPASRVLDQDAAHRLGGGTEEMRSVLPRQLLAVDQAEVGLVDQGGRLQGLAGALTGHLRASEPSELGVQDRQ